MKTLILDPGHGGDDTGALGRRTRLRESDVTLWTASRIEQILSTDPGVRTIMTHGGGGSSLANRAQLANEANADLFLSIHCNSAESSAAHGFEVWTSPGQTAADPIATAIYNSIRDTFPEIAWRRDIDDGDPDKEARFYVLRKTRCPAVLVEMAFISNFSEEILLSTDVWRWRYARAIVEGLIGWPGP